jgi:hypothetical protein
MAIYQFTDLCVIRKLESITIYVMALLQEAVNPRCQEHLIWDAHSSGITRVKGFCDSLGNRSLQGLFGV